MTILCAIAQEQRVFFGSDTYTSIADGSMYECGSKWVQYTTPRTVDQPFGQQWAFGLTGDHKSGDIVEYHKADIFADAVVADHKTVFEILRRVRERFEENGILSLRRSQEEGGALNWANSGILINSGGHIWEVDGTFSMCKIKDNVFHARGSGADYALGAASAYRLARPKTPPQTLIKMAIEVCALHSNAIKGVWQSEL